MTDFQVETITDIDDGEPITIIRKIVDGKVWSQPLVEGEGLHAEMLEWVEAGGVAEVIEG